MGGMVDYKALCYTLTHGSSSNALKAPTSVSSPNCSFWLANSDNLLTLQVTCAIFTDTSSILRLLISLHNSRSSNLCSIVKAEKLFSGVCTKVQFLLNIALALCTPRS